MTAPTLVVFDLDGTLVDSRRDIAEAMNDALTAWGAAALPEVVLGRMVGDGAGVLVARACAAASLPMPADGLAQFLSRYDARLTRWTRPYAGTVEMLTALADRVKDSSPQASRLLAHTAPRALQAYKRNAALTPKQLPAPTLVHKIGRAHV